MVEICVDGVLPSGAAGLLAYRTNPNAMTKFPPKRQGLPTCRRGKRAAKSSRLGCIPVVGVFSRTGFLKPPRRSPCQGAAPGLRPQGLDVGHCGSVVVAIGASLYSHQTACLREWTAGAANQNRRGLFCRKSKWLCCFRGGSTAWPMAPVKTTQPSADPSAGARRHSSLGMGFIARNRPSGLSSGSCPAGYQRRAAVCTGASQSFSRSASRAVTVREQPAMSREVQ